MLRFCKVSIKKPEVCSSSEENFEHFEFAKFSDSDNEENAENATVPWLLKRCLNNLGVRFDEEVRKYVCQILMAVSNYFIFRCKEIKKIFRVLQ